MSLPDSYEFKPKNRQKPTSKIRTKIRPIHTKTKTIWITAIDKGRYTGIDINNSNLTFYCIKGKELSRTLLTVGDYVDIIPAKANNTDSLSRIVKLKERKSYLNRTTDDSQDSTKYFAANHDQVLIIQSICKPDPNIGLILRLVLASLAGGIKPTVIITKTDLQKSTSELTNKLNLLRIPYLEINQHNNLADINAILKDKISVLVGNSGVGKSSLVNRLIPAAKIKVGEVSKIGTGKHTSTKSEVIPLDSTSWMIDTPGIRSLGLKNVDKATFIKTFPQLEAYSQDKKISEPSSFPPSNQVEYEKIYGEELGKQIYNLYQIIFNRDCF